MNPSAGRARSCRTCAARFVHRHQHVGRGDQRRIDGLPRQAHMAIRSAGAHLRPIRRQPRNFKPRIESGLGQHFAQQQHALPAKARYAHLQDRYLRATALQRRIAFGQIFLGDAKNPRNLLERWRAARATVRGCASLVRSQNTPSGKVFSITSRTQCCASTGVHLPDRRARRKHFDQREAQPLHLILDGALRMARVACAICLLSPSPTRSM